MKMSNDAAKMFARQIARAKQNGQTHWAKAVGSAANAVAWLLDPDNSTAFCAVLDPDDMQVATLEGGVPGCVVWQSLASFLEEAE